MTELLDRFRKDELLLVSQYGGCARWQAMKTQELFMRKVAPRLRRAAEKLGKKTSRSAIG